MPKLLYHLYLRKGAIHKYYSSFTALFNDNPEIGISYSYVQKWKWNLKGPYKNENCIIRKGQSKSTSDIK